jgi:hypothetical protein
MRLARRALKGHFAGLELAKSAKRIGPKNGVSNFCRVVILGQKPRFACTPYLINR